jgi:hypothetical protein
MCKSARRAVLKGLVHEVTPQRNPDDTIVNIGSTMQTPNLFSSITFASSDARHCTLAAVAIQTPQTRDNQFAQFTLSDIGPPPAQDAKDTTKLCGERTKSAPRFCAVHPGHGLAR